MAAGNPYSFLHVNKPEIDLPADTDVYSEAVYKKGAENLRRLIADKVIFQDKAPCFLRLSADYGRAFADWHGGRRISCGI